MFLINKSYIKYSSIEFKEAQATKIAKKHTSKLKKLPFNTSLSSCKDLIENKLTLNSSNNRSFIPNL